MSPKLLWTASRRTTGSVAAAGTELSAVVATRSSHTTEARPRLSRHIRLTRKRESRKPDSHDDPSGGFPAASSRGGSLLAVHGRTGTHDHPSSAHRACGWSRTHAAPASTPSTDSYRRLADVFHDLLSEQSLDSLLVRIADTLDEIVPYEALHIYEADEPKRHLVPALVRSDYADEILNDTFPFGVGITGWAVEHREPVLSNQAHLDPARRLRPGNAGRSRGADRRAADRTRRAQGNAERLPDRRARVLQRRRVRARAAARRRRRARARQRPHPRAARARGADRLAHRPLQPPLLPRAPPPRADARLGRAHERRGRDGRHRRLQEGQRRLRARRRRRGAGGARRPPPRDASAPPTSSAGSAARSSP